MLGLAHSVFKRQQALLMILCVCVCFTPWEIVNSPIGKCDVNVCNNRQRALDRCFVLFGTRQHCVLFPIYLCPSVLIFSSFSRHALPGSGDFAVLLKTGMRIKEALFFNVVSSVLSLFGMLVGIALGNVESASYWIFAVTAGTFIYIALVDMVRGMFHNMISLIFVYISVTSSKILFPEHPKLVIAGETNSSAHGFESHFP
ncbi:unnamed protein product [Echinostoma caproni]|uniref:DUF1275 domain-containing protein n=1 Tax=Echinostoma caproni TaxID=27848 RepID=A0A183ATN0_9TREM|nr:unnamed protein product [Echinostoma caproni]